METLCAEGITVKGEIDKSLEVLKAGPGSTMVTIITRCSSLGQLLYDSSASQSPVDNAINGYTCTPLENSRGSAWLDLL